MKRLGKLLMVAMILFFSITLLPTANVEAKTKVKLNKTSVTVTVGNKKTVKLKNAKKKVTWKITKGKKNVAIKKKSGKYKSTIKLQGKKAGSATITAKVKGNKKTYKCKVTVKKKKATSTSGNTNKSTSESAKKLNNTDDKNETPKPFIEKVEQNGEYIVKICGWTKPNARMTVESPTSCKRTNARNNGYFEFNFYNFDQLDITVTAYSNCEPYTTIAMDGSDKENNGEIINQQIIPYSYKNPEKIEKMIEEIKTEYNISDSSSDIEKCKAVAEWLCYHLEYDHEVIEQPDLRSEKEHYQGAEDVLINGRAVCQGYSNAYELLMTHEFHVSCRYLAYIFGNHAWNQVQIDGKWYNVDVTWMDQTDDDYFLLEIDYQYFMVSEERLNRFDRSGIHNYYSSDYLKNNYPTDDTRFDDFTVLYSDDVEYGWENRFWWNSDEWKNHL